MNDAGQRGRGRQRRRLRDGSGPHRGARSSCGEGQSLGSRTATRMLVAAGTYVAQDLRDADGLLRPALRRAALSCSLSERRQLRRLGSAYLRLDPPQPDAEADRAVAVEAAPEGAAALPAARPDAGATLEHRLH